MSAPWWTTPSSIGGDAAVALSPSGEHVGVLWRDEGGALRHLHLASDRDLRCDAPRADADAAVSPLEPERLAQVAQMCRRVWRRHENHKLRYGFRYDRSRFERSGELRLGPDEVGLTCATLVLAVYRSVGLELLRRDEWPERLEDTARWVTLVAMLEAHGVDAAHIRALRGQTDAPRYRPDEVAAASSVAPPCPFSEASARATALAKARGRSPTTP
jgi:hypothetical protein